MNLKERMQHQNKNNSSILNNSNFDFAKGNREDQIYEKSRRECEEELYKRKSDLEQEKHSLIKMKEKEVTYAVEKFNNDFEEVRKQIVNQINQSLSEMKLRYTAEIRERCMVETSEELKLRTSIDEFLTIINSHISGLKKGTSISIFRPLQGINCTDCSEGLRLNTLRYQKCYSKTQIRSSFYRDR